MEYESLKYARKQAAKKLKPQRKVAEKMTKTYEELEARGVKAARAYLETQVVMPASTKLSKAEMAVLLNFEKAVRAGIVEVLKATQKPVYNEDELVDTMKDEAEMVERVVDALNGQKNQTQRNKAKATLRALGLMEEGE